MAWQTIDSVPKDGSRVLVWAQSLREEPFIAHWTIDGWADDCDDLDLRDDELTHWMPLPDQPLARVTR